MPLVKCKECKTPISVKAANCPHCGYSKPKRGSMGLGTLLGVLALGFWASTYFDTDSPPKTHPEKTAKTLNAKEARQQQIKQSFSSWSGSHAILEYAIKSQLKEPDSYKHIETNYQDDGKNLIVITKYKAKNSFGAYAEQSVIATITTEGEILSYKSL